MFCLRSSDSHTKKISSHVFAGITMEKKYAKSQRKPRNSTVYCVGALKSFDFFRQKTWFWVNNKSFYQVCKQNFSIQNLKKMNNQIMRNFELKSESYFKVF